MSTVLIDKTLSYLPVPADFIEREQLMKYIDGIFNCGADYIEINTSIIDLLENVDLSKKYILRIKSLADLKMCLDYDFAYVVLPIALTPFYSKLSLRHNIIAEIHADEYSVLSYLLTLKESSRFNNISMIRLTGNIATGAESAASFMKWYRRNLHIPVDICPLNTMLSGSGDAIAFYRENADAITLSFGSNHYYTAFEDFLINRQILNRSFMPQEVISALCSASLAFMKIFSSLPCGMERIAAKDNAAMAPVFDIEKGILYRPFKPSQKKNKSEENVIERQIRTIGLEREIEDAIIDMLKKTNFSFYQNIIKRNIID